MSGSSPVEPVDAATVVLVRHGRPVGAPWQCFMVRRHVRSEFAADVYVFPGGKVDPEDCTREAADYTVSHPLPGEEDGSISWLALKLAGIRELFEEAGVLLATDRDGGLVRLDGANAERFAAWRRQVQAGQLSLLELARVEGLRYAVDRLHPFSRWVTPVTSPRRYDTRFFVAIMPERQEPVHDALETTDSVWIAPQDALARYREGEFPLVFATEKHLDRMARYPSIEQLIASTAAADLQPVVPRAVEREGERIFLLPGDPGY